MKGCPFCQRVTAGEYDYSDLYSVAFQPLNPVVPGHFLVVPRTHVTDAITAPNYFARAARLAGGLAASMGLTACNMITSAGTAATQTVMHLHIHVVPRHEGDGLLLPWTPQQHEEVTR